MVDVSLGGNDLVEKFKDISERKAALEAKLIKPLGCDDFKKMKSSIRALDTSLEVLNRKMQLQCNH